VAVVGEVVSAVGVTDSGTKVPVAKARIRKVDADQLSDLADDAATSFPSPGGGAAQVIAVESVGSWSSGHIPEEEAEGRDADIAAAAGAMSPPARLQESVEARVAAAVASVGRTTPTAVDKRFTLPGRQDRNALFDRFDANGNGGLSLAEIDKAVLELWPHFDHKRALMRAYKAADTNRDGFIKRREFRSLLKYIVYFNELWETFEAIDTNHDHRLNQSEFREGVKQLGMELSEEEVGAAFADMDENGGGYVLFDEFCGWCAAASASAEVEEVEAAVTAAVEAEEAAAAVAAAGGEPAEQKLTAVARVVEEEILADDGLIRSPTAVATPVADSGGQQQQQHQDPIALTDDDDFASVVCPEGLKPGDM